MVIQETYPALTYPWRSPRLHGTARDGSWLRGSHSDLDEGLAPVPTAGRNLGPHRRRGPGLLVKGNQHLLLPASSSSITPRMIERATSHGYLRGST